MSQTFQWMATLLARMPLVGPAVEPAAAELAVQEDYYDVMCSNPSDYTEEGPLYYWEIVVEEGRNATSVRRQLSTSCFHFHQPDRYWPHASQGRSHLSLISQHRTL